MSNRTMIATIAAALLGLPVLVCAPHARAQGPDQQPWWDKPAQPSQQIQRLPRVRRDDAYRAGDTGPGLGSLNGPDGRTAPAAGEAYDARAGVGASAAQSPYGQGYGQGYGAGQSGQYSQSAPAPGGYPAYGSEPLRAQPGYSRETSGNPSYPQPPYAQNGYGAGRPTDTYSPPPANGAGNGGYAGATQYGGNSGYGQPYSPPPADYDRADDGQRRPYMSGERPPYRDDRPEQRGDGTFSSNEIMTAGHGFFGSISQGLASVVEYAFKRQGRPNGYILGEDAGGAFVAGLRYGEGTLYTKDAGSHRVYWQGPSLGYDVGVEGAKVMVLVYNLRDPSEIYDRFGGVSGSAYFVGGVGLNFQTKDHIVLAPIRSGVGLRLGANIGYLKYTQRPTWNPF